MPDSPSARPDRVGVLHGCNAATRRKSKARAMRKSQNELSKKIFVPRAL
jgi:hypothetical protein